VVFVMLRQRGLMKLTFDWLVVASLFFYGWWKLSNLPLLLGSLLFNYAMGTWLGRLDKQGPARTVLTVGLIANLLFLGYFKYANFFIDNANTVFGVHWGFTHIVLPLGISFYTFQKIAYLVDSYGGLTRGYGFRDFCLFVSFFPQLITGPIVHHSEMMPQFKKEYQQGPNWMDFSVGMTLFVIGLAKKALIADQFARWASPVFDAAQAGGSPGFAASWVGAVAYAIQVYFDFSGYSDMAIGLARLFSIRLPLNFNSPYKARNISDFWRRWHMTLSRLLRDYLYIPLGGNRCGRTRRYFNLMTTMLISGLWHGAGWPYIFMGGLQGIYLSVYQGWAEWRKRRGHVATTPTVRGVWTGRVVTFLAVVVSYVFFRAASLGAAFKLQKSMFGFNGLSFASTEIPLGTAFWACVVMMLVVWFFPNSHEMLRRYQPALEYMASPCKVSHAPTPEWLNRRLEWNPTVAWALWLAILMAASLVCLSRPSEFIYWQF
jgi:D-alanyl-lipoteichoic acid acyltransferase DltB (MBOAT superfamily)